MLPLVDPVIPGQVHLVVEPLTVLLLLGSEELLHDMLYHIWGSAYRRDALSANFLSKDEACAAR